MKNTNNQNIAEVKPELLLKDTTFQLRSVDKAVIEELAVDLSGVIGQLHPVIARKCTDGHLQLIAGWHRVHACLLAGVLVRVEIREIDDDQALALAFAENKKRKTFTNWDTLQFMVRLKDGKYPVKAISKITDIEEPRIYDILRINDFPVLAEHFKENLLGLEQCVITAKGLSKADVKPGAKILESIVSEIHSYGKVPSYDTVLGFIDQAKSRFENRSKSVSTPREMSKPTQLKLVYGDYTPHKKLIVMLDQAKKAVTDLERLIEKCPKPKLNSNKAPVATAVKRSN